MSWRIGLLLLGMQALAAWIFLAGAGPGFPLDDAWGHLVYGRSLAQGELFAYNPGQPEAGVTAPLWTLLCAGPAALVEWLGLPRPDGGMRVLGFVCGLLTALVAWRLAHRAGTWPAVFAALVVTFDPLMLAGRYSGMELPLFGLLTLLLIEAVLDVRPGAAGWIAGLAMLTRPEGLVLAALAAVMLAARRRLGAGYLLPLLLCAAPFAAFNQWVAGHPWPNTWQNKAATVFEPQAIWDALLALARDTGWGWALPVVLAVGLVTFEGAARRLARTSLAFGGAMLLGVMLTREMPVENGFDPPRLAFYFERYALVAWLPVLFVMSAGASSVVRTAWAGFYCRPRMAVLMVGPALVVGALASGLPGHGAEVARRFAAESADVEALNVAAGLWIDGHLPPDALVATHDAGALRYFGRRPVLDIYGNNDAELNRLIAQRDGLVDANATVLQRAHQAVLDYLASRRPVALAVFPIQYAAAHSPEVAELVGRMPPDEARALIASIDDYTELFGLTRRAVTFRVEHPSVFPSALHQSLAVFVRP